MALDFTSIHDQPGAAIYFIHDGTEAGENEMTLLISDVARRSRKQTVMMSSKDENGRKVIDFYDLMGSKFVIIVRDNDQIHHVWSDGDRFNAHEIARLAEQAG